MKQSLAVWLFVLLCVLTEPRAAMPGLTLTFASLAQWQEKSFKGRTTYALVKHNGRDLLHAVADGSASGLYRKVAVNPRELPVLSWSWKVDRTVAAEDPCRKSGDDFAARVYVVFPGRFFWQTRALAYVWSDKLPMGTVIPNSYTDNVAVIAVESGNRHGGIWRHESRRYGEDYRNYFHCDPPDTAAVAVMTDGDDTGSRAEAWYGDIAFSSR